MGIYVSITPPSDNPELALPQLVASLVSQANASPHPEYESSYLTADAIVTVAPPRDDLPQGGLGIRLSVATPDLSDALYRWFRFAEHHQADFWWGHERITIHTLPRMVKEAGGDAQAIRRLLGTE